MWGPGTRVERKKRGRPRVKRALALRHGARQRSASTELRPDDSRSKEALRRVRCRGRAPYAQARGALPRARVGCGSSRLVVERLAARRPGSIYVGAGHERAPRRCWTRSNAPRPSAKRSRPGAGRASPEAAGRSASMPSRAPRTRAEQACRSRSGRRGANATWSSGSRPVERRRSFTARIAAARRRAARRRCSSLASPSARKPDDEADLDPARRDRTGGPGRQHAAEGRYRHEARAEPR